MRRGVALSAVVAALVGLAFMQTPVMRQSRGIAWNTWVVTIARVFQIHDALPQPDLSARLEQLTTDNIRLRAEAADYQRLREQLKTPTVDQLRPVMAAIIGRPLDTLESEFIISKGLSDGIAINDPVVVIGSSLVGFVSEIQRNSAIVRTLYHPDTRVTAEVVADKSDNTTPARGLLVSRLYTALFLTTIPRDIPISPGQPVVTVADASTTPPGLVIGTIESVSSREHDAYQEARIKTAYDIGAVDAVTVLTQP